jgi:hypothetical protein
MAKVNPKQLVIDHGEKAAFGLIVVLVLLAIVGTNWSPYDKSPEDITTKVADAEAKITVTTWPDEEQKTFALDESMQPARVVDAGINDRIAVAPTYMASQTLMKDKEARDDPLQTPVFQPVVDMIASSARVLIELPPDPAEMLASAVGEQEAGAEGTSEESPADEDLRDEFLDRGTAGNVPGAVSGVPGAEPYGPTGEGQHGAMPGASRDYSSTLAPELMMESMMHGAVSGTDGMAMGAAPVTANGKGYPFVSVRGVFEYKEQVRKYTEAIHKGYADALKEFAIIDFELQRQQLVAAPDTWTEWELVDTQVFRDVVNEAAALEGDVVSADVTDSAITCPLPRRLTGRWNKQATHPRLTKFELTDEQMQREMEFNHALLSKFFDEKKNLPAGPVQKKGFADMVFDSRELQQGYMGLESSYDMATMMNAESSSAMSMMHGAEMPTASGRPGGGGMDPELEKFAKDLAEKMGTDANDPKVKEELTKWIKDRAQPEGELLLFRYLDFDVEPGETYRYRVQLILKNPNYLRPLASAGGNPEVVAGETRPTGWSEPTPPITVEETVNYYLTRVEPVRAPRTYPEARMNVFQYDQEAGTTVQQELEVAFGQHVGGETRAMKADPTEGTFEETDYTFHSDDVLVDALPDLTFKASEHPDLKLPPDSRGYSQMTEYAIVVTESNSLSTLDPKSQGSELKEMLAYMEQQDKYFEYLQQAAPAEGAMEGEYANIYQELYGGTSMSGTDMGSAPRGRNSLRRGQAPGTNSGMGPMGGGAHGATTMPATPGTQPPRRPRR